MDLITLEEAKNQIHVNVSECDSCKGIHTSIKCRPILDDNEKPVKKSSKLTHWFLCDVTNEVVEVKPPKKK